jgi:hypothetical protein
MPLGLAIVNLPTQSSPGVAGWFDLGRPILVIRRQDTEIEVAHGQGRLVV